MSAHPEVRCLLDTPDEAAAARDRLRELGVLVVAGVVDESLVTELRERLDALSPDVPSVNMLPTQVLSTELVREVPFLPAVVDALTRTVGEGYVVYPNFTARRNVYVPWHTDTAFRTSNGGWQEAAEFIQCAVYLQDNDSKLGGGLEVVPGSHRRILVNGSYYAPAQVLNVYGERMRVPNRAGDLVMFDGRLLHGSTGMGGGGASAKYGIFWTVSRTEERRRPFLRHLRERRLNRVGDDGKLVEDPRFPDLWNVVYPTSYPPSAMEAAERGALRIATMAEVAE